MSATRPQPRVGAQPGSPPAVVLRQRTVRRLATALLGASLLAASLAGPATAASQTRSASIGYSGSGDPGYWFDVRGLCDQCIPDAVGVVLGGGSWAYGVTATGFVDHLAWSAVNDTVAEQFDDANLRQGRTLDLTDVLTPQTGTIVATGSVKGSGGLLNDPSGGSNFQASGSSTAIDTSATWTATGCTLPLPSQGPTTCTSDTQDLQLLSKTVASVELGDVNVVIRVRLSLTFTIDSDGTILARSVTFNGVPGSLDRTLTFTSPSLGDPIALSCAIPAGTEVRYSLNAGDTTPQTTVAGNGTVRAEAVFSPVVGPDVDVFGGDIGSIAASAVPAGLSLTGGSDMQVLGTLAPNNIPPTPDAGGGSSHAYAGQEGAPVQFDGSGSSSPCGFPTLRWDFSDGGVAFGAKPVHTFEGAGTYSGLLTATDMTGLTSTQTFSVAISNVPPVVIAGGGITAAWGRSITFAGQATDPGADDQSTLVYSWNFGDGTPSATGGATVAHAYTTPGTYTATLTVCDRWLACAQDTRTILVRARSVSLGSIGDTAATFGTPAARHGSLVDEFGQAVNGRTITFTVDGSAAGSAVTNSSGVGSTAWTPGLGAGTYATSASFSGDSLYTAAAGAGSVTIARKATTTTYLGSLTGAPNKTVTLTASLVDATGTALAGRTIRFQLGSQTATATTSSTGVATTQVKLAQKNGTYALTATWTPTSGSDAERYLGSGASATFKLQAK